MQEKHRIDDRFRRVLANAEAEPPASVWAGIAAAQDKRRRGGAWYWGRYAGLALVGTALMRSNDPAGTVAEFRRAGAQP